MTFQPGDTIDGGKYRVVRLLGEGGMGAVYEGENARIHRRVAIKVLHRAVAAKADVMQRFEREAQAAGRIGSEHIVEVLDLGSAPEGDRFMVMEYLEGESLGERIRRKGRLLPQEVTGVLHQLLSGLAAAHGADIIHRDLKPDNVFLVHARAGRRDFVKILDFGVSKFAALDAELSMTKTGAVVGTPFYMSPEQARGQEIDVRSDLFSVGVVAYQAVTGRVPFNAATFNELVFKIALESPEPADVVAPDLDPGFAAIIARAMMRDPDGRFQSAAEFQAAISTWGAAAGVTIEPADVIAATAPPGLLRSRAASGASSVELGLAKTVSGETTAAASAATAARPGRSLVVAAGAMMAMTLGGLGAYALLGTGGARGAAATPAATPISSAPLPPPTPTVVATAEPTASATAAPVESAAPTVTATAEPVPVTMGETPKPPAQPAQPTGRWPKPKASGTPKASERPMATAAPVGPGRTIGSEL